MGRRNRDTLVLEVDNVTKVIGNKKILSAVSFTVKRGEIFGILGPNGAGKTMLLYTMLGLLIPDTGRVLIFNKHLQDNRQEILQQINFASSFSRLNGYSTVFENLFTFAQLYQIPNAKDKIASVLSRFHMLQYLRSNVKVFRLSNGENTKVNICKALLNDPEILFFDEVTATLDPPSRDELYDLIAELKKSSTTVIFISHNENEVKKLCDRIMVIKKGTITYMGRNFSHKLSTLYE